jgi:hypothetical protein
VHTNYIQSLPRNSLNRTISINHQVSSTILWQSADHLRDPALVVNSSILFLSLFVRQFVSGTSAGGGSKVERSAGLKGMRDGIMTSRRGRETWQLCSREKLFPWFARPRLDWVANARPGTEKSMRELPTTLVCLLAGIKIFWQNYEEKIKLSGKVLRISDKKNKPQIKQFLTAAMYRAKGWRGEFSKHRRIALYASAKLCSVSVKKIHLTSAIRFPFQVVKFFKKNVVSMKNFYKCSTEWITCLL